LTWKRSAAALLTALAMATGACSAGTESDPNALDLEVDQLLRWTAPEGARVGGTGPLRREHSSVETSWEVEAEQDWMTYRTAFDHAARAAGYQPGALGDTEAWFFRPETGDTYYLHVEILDHGPPLRVRVSFAARAG
jgi:hypothetical protein